MASTLAGRRILITRTRSQASTLAAALIEHGAIPIVIPALEIVPPASFAELDKTLATLSDFDWVILTSSNAVNAAASRARTLHLTLRPRRVAVIGPATAAALPAAAISPAHGPVLLPTTAVAESLLERLLPLLADRPARLGPASIALLRAELARDLLPDTLRDAGALVTIATAYRTVIPAASVEALRQSFSFPRAFADAVTFTSSSTATHLPPLLSSAGLTLPPDTLRISIGPVTSATLRELGMPPHAEAAAPTIPALIEALIQAFSLPARLP